MNDANEQAQPEFQVMIQIVVNKDGQMGMTGMALNDELLAYGVLEKAKLMVKAMHEPKVLRPQGNFLNGLRANGVH